MPRSTSPLMRSAQRAAKKSRSKPSNSPSRERAIDDTPDWMTKGRGNIAAKKNSGGSGGNQKFTPEFFMQNGESAILKFVQPYGELESAVGRHQYPAFSKAGKKYFKSFTCTGHPDTCAGCANGDRATMRWPVLVIDTRELEYQEYDPNTKQKNRVKKSNVVKLWLPSVNELERFFGAVEDYEEDNKPVRDSARLVARVRRTGAGPQTAYSFTIKKAVKLSEADQKKVDEFIAEYGNITDILKPLPLAEQRAIVGVPAKDDEEYGDDDDDEYSDGDLDEVDVD